MFLTLVFLAFAVKPSWVKASDKKLLAEPQLGISGDDGNTKQLSVSEAEKFINDYNGLTLAITGDQTTISMSISPKTTLLTVSISKVAGRININRESFYIIPEKNDNLVLSIKTSGKKVMMELNNSIKVSMPLLVLTDDWPGLSAVDIEFQGSLRKIKEFDFMSYPDGVKLPPVNPISSSYNFEVKTKDITDEYGDGSGKKLSMDYYEISPVVSDGAIAGIVIACVAVVGGIIGGVIYAIKCKKSKGVTQN